MIMGSLWILDPVVVAATHAGIACHEGPVPGLYHAVCFGMVGWHGPMIDDEDLALLLPKDGHGLCSSVKMFLLGTQKRLIQLYSKACHATLWLTQLTGQTLLLGSMYLGI